MGIKRRHLNQYISLLEKHVSTSMTDTDGVIVCASEAFCEMTGYSESELIGKKHNLLRHPDMAQEIYQNLWMTITEGKPWHGRIKNLTKNKGLYWVDAYIEPIFDNGTIIGYQAVRQNITDETLFESQAKIDSLTGLYNRHSIEEFAQLLIDEAQRYQTPFSIIMVDLDDFKQVNDLYGHSMGDEVLKKISTIFKDLVRSSDRVGR
ncbi:MAG: diguanylate cyclase, partial [Sulfurimonas sp.]|nr:diguanylate cyclase [Sulfurimonas sp.]